jgi:asparagine synthase (glutamine-hydrolysing)
MQNFFGFIDYNKNNPNLENNHKNKRTHYHEYENYNIFLSYTKHKESNSLDNKDILLLFNGELSNSSFLLSKLNITNKKLSVIELINIAYLTWGKKLLIYLEGNFSLIIFDKKNEYLILNKDKIGIIPLSYYFSKELIIFGSRVSDFKNAPNFTATVNINSVANYLQFGSIIQPNTILKNCYKVKSGTSSNFDLRQKEYFNTSNWSLESEYIDKKVLFDESKIITDAENLLISAIKKSKIDTNPISLSLSGGYDSSTIAALLKKSDYNLETFTIGFEDDNINEAPHAKAIANHLGTKHHEHYFTATDAINIIPKLSQIYDEPFADHAAAPTLLTTEMIRTEGIENLFVGDGGDEVFATADDVHFFDRILSLPYELRKTITAPLKMINIDSLPYLRDINNLPTKYEKLLSILSAKNIPQMTKSKNILFREKELQSLVKGYKQPIHTTFDEIDFNGYNETVDEIIGVYFKTTMIDGELVKSYSASNHNNISIHTPFLDDQLISYMAKVPSSIKIKDGIKKYVLKEIAHKYIPKELLDRPKSGFDIPFSSWMRKELKDMIYAQINNKRLKEDNIFNSYDIIKIRDDFYNGNDNYKYKLWRIFLFQLWYENFKGYYK